MKRLLAAGLLAAVSSIALLADSSAPGAALAASPEMTPRMVQNPPPPPPPTCVGCGAKASSSGSITHRSNCPYLPKKEQKKR
ncbi:MAG TPA: hypothetical protein VGK03_07490 [Geothrix sp.]|jgi:hypothetical protein